MTVPLSPDAPFDLDKPEEAFYVWRHKATLLVITETRTLLRRAFYRAEDAVNWLMDKQCVFGDVTTDGDQAHEYELRLTTFEEQANERRATVGVLFLDGEGNELGRRYWA